MNTLFKKLGGAAALLTLTTSAVHAASWLECEGNKIKWNDSWTNMYISTTSFPAGSSWDGDLQNAMWHWNNVKGAGFNFFVGRDTDGTHAKDNGHNEIYLHGTEVGSALAVTFTRYHCYWLFGYQYGLDEADIAFNSNLGWNTGKLDYANLGSPYNFELVALHELGHALGLQHSDGVQATMNSFYANGGPLGNSKEVDPLPDDRRGVRTLYGDSTTERDVASSPFKRTGTGTTGLVSSPTSAARGSQVTIGYTFGNLGTSSATFNIGFYLSTNSIISTGDRLLGSNTGASAGAGAIGSFTRTLTIPADVAPGTYYLGFLVDKDSALAENNEGNNGQPMPRSITIF
jgi:hypothetical protein